MGEFDKEIKASDGSVALGREKDGIAGSEKRKYNKIQSVKIPKFARPLSKHAKIESASKEQQAQDENWQYIECYRPFKRPNEEVYAKLKNHVIYSDQINMVLFCRGSENSNFEEEFSVDYGCTASNKEEEEESDQEEDDDYKDLWSFEMKGGNGGVKRCKEKEEQSEGKIYAQYSSESKKEVVTDKWYASESPYQEYCEMSKVYGERITEWDELLRSTPPSEITGDVSHLYRKFKREDCLRGLPKSEAIKLINLAMWVEKSFSPSLHWYRCLEKLFSIIPCITVKTDKKARYFAKTCISLGHFYYLPRQYLQRILEAIEPVFHPSIRKENIKEIGWLAKRDYRIEEREEKESSKKFLKPLYDEKRIKILNERFSSEAYQNAMKIMQLHQGFDLHLALCSHLNENSKIKDLMADENVVPAQYRTLDESLIKASLKLRVKLLRKISEYKLYVAWMAPFLKLKAKMGHTMLDEVLKAVREVRPDFPNLPDDYIIDEKQVELSSFCDLLSEIKRFLNCPVSDRYLMEGIIAYLSIHGIRTIKLRQQNLHSWQRDCMTRLLDLKRVWGRRHYEHPVYSTLFDENLGNDD